ncbi:arsenate reductase family protein [Lactococcus fujiensis]|uniref:Arsenate reductase n=1 Tax=Lactococcus fujiensis JCM 16395 TaxID=1291764 RepID=A0A2A5RPU3_9LACT|nr:arsenate reductase family protein [Lactococcus fujiensis]PCS01470.1 arsenate reductase [Lactococcus fujiensis JCM 16395]
MYTFYWYPKCSTCKKAKAILDQRKIAYEAIDIKTEPPQAKQFEQWFKQGTFPEKKFFNTSGLVYRALNLKDKFDNLSSSERAALLSSDGMLIKRPLIIKDNQIVAVGFDEEFYRNELAKK